MRKIKDLETFNAVVLGYGNKEIATATFTLDTAGTLWVSGETADGQAVRELGKNDVVGTDISYREQVDPLIRM